MKHVRKLIVLIAMMLLTVGCDNEKIVPAEQLPSAAKTYIQTNQPGTQILFVKKEREWFSTKYKVQLDNRVEIEFDGDGLPIDMDMDD